MEKMDPRTFVNGVEGGAQADTHTVDEGSDDLLFAASHTAEGPTPPTGPPADTPRRVTDWPGPPEQRTSTNDEATRLPPPPVSESPNGREGRHMMPSHRTTLPVPTAGEGGAAGSHPMHMPYTATAGLSLPDPALLVPPAEPDWHPPFTKPEPRTYRVFGFELGKKRFAFWQQQRDNHEHMRQRQRDEYNEAVAVHEAAIAELRGIMTREMRELYKESRSTAAGLGSIVLCPVHSKGGVGKTPTATAVAAVLGQAASLPVFLVDANPFRGGAGVRSGVEHDEVINLTYALEHHHRLTMADYLGMINPTQYNVLTIASDPENVDEIDPENFVALLDSLSRLSPIILVDTGNHILGPLNRAIYRRANALMFPMLTHWGPMTVNGPVDDLLGSKHALNLLAERYPETDGSFRVKTTNGVTIALGLTADQDEADFQRAAGNDSLMLTVPWDVAAATPQPLVLPTRDGVLTPQKGVLSPYTAVAWMRVARAILEQAKLNHQQLGATSPGS